jgi:hypothetical protein
MRSLARARRCCELFFSFVTFEMDPCQTKCRRVKTKQELQAKRPIAVQSKVALFPFGDKPRYQLLSIRRPLSSLALAISFPTCCPHPRRDHRISIVKSRNRKRRQRLSHFYTANRVYQLAQDTIQPASSNEHISQCSNTLSCRITELLLAPPRIRLTASDSNQYSRVHQDTH